MILIIASFTPSSPKTWYSLIGDRDVDRKDNQGNTRTLIFPKLSKRWGKLSSKNNYRNRIGHVDGYLQKNVVDLERKLLSEANQHLKQKYQIILEVGRYF